MINSMITEKFLKHYPSYDIFVAQKVASDDTNTAYLNFATGDAVESSEIDIKWSDICFINNEKLIWTHGSFYGEKDSDPKYHHFATIAEWEAAASEFDEDEISYIDEDESLRYGAFVTE